MIILGYILLICSVTLLLLLIATMWAGLRSPNWPQTIGEIRRVDLYETHDKKRFGPLVEYSYEVENKPFTSTSFDLNLFTTRDKNYVEGLLSDFREKESLTVYYHPWFHRFSLLVPGIKNLKSLLLFLLVVVIMFIFSIYEIQKNA